jgi:hypothetical protein
MGIPPWSGKEVTRLSTRKHRFCVNGGKKPEIDSHRRLSPQSKSSAKIAATTATQGHASPLASMRSALCAVFSGQTPLSSSTSYRSADHVSRLSHITADQTTKACTELKRPVVPSINAHKEKVGDRWTQLQFFFSSNTWTQLHFGD